MQCALCNIDDLRAVLEHGKSRACVEAIGDLPLKFALDVGCVDFGDWLIHRRCVGRFSQ